MRRRTQRTVAAALAAATVASALAASPAGAGGPLGAAPSEPVARRGAATAPAPDVATTDTTAAVATEPTTDPTATTAPTDTTVAPTAPGGPACDTVAHIGDSTTVGLGSMLGRAYDAAGWSAHVVDAGVGRSVFRALRGDVTGLAAVDRIKAAGFRGCWVVALGINDIANIDAGDNRTPEETVARVLDRIGPAPVLWLTIHLPRHVATTARFNAAIAGDGRALVFDWGAEVAANPGYLASDKIHFTFEGSRQLAKRVAEESVRLRGATLPADWASRLAVPPPPPPTTAPRIDREQLRYNAGGREVASLQRALGRVGFDLRDDRGRYRVQTMLAMLRYSRARGLRPSLAPTPDLLVALGLQPAP
jgi:lysophospholipase L1-like esterase